MLSGTGVPSRKNPPTPPGRVHRDVEEAFFGLGRRYPSEGSDFRITQLTLGECSIDALQFTERPSHAHVLSRRRGADADAPGEPVRRGQEPRTTPPFASVKLAQVREHCMFCDVNAQ